MALLVKQHYENILGFIDYGYDSDNRLMVFMGSYVYKNSRGSGAFKKMLKDLLAYFPIGTTIQVPISNKHLVPLFKRMEFIQVNKIEFWGEIKGSILMQGILMEDTISKI